MVVKRGPAHNGKEKLPKKGPWKAFCELEILLYYDDTADPPGPSGRITVGSLFGKERALESEGIAVRYNRRIAFKPISFEVIIPIILSVPIGVATSYAANWLFHKLRNKNIKTMRIENMGQMPFYDEETRFTEVLSRVLDRAISVILEMQRVEMVSMQGPFELKSEVINGRVKTGMPGYFLLSNKENPFVPIFVGRSDNDLRPPLQELVGEYKYFLFDYSDSARDAFEKECILYHKYMSMLQMKSHPARTPGENWGCPIPICTELDDT